MSILYAMYLRVHVCISMLKYTREDDEESEEEAAVATQSFPINFQLIQFIFLPFFLLSSYVISIVCLGRKRIRKVEREKRFSGCW